MRTITRSEFVNGAGEGVYVSTVHYASAAEREAGDAACQRVVVAAAFVPFGDKGEPFDPPERCIASGFGGAVSGHALRLVPGETFQVYEDPWPSDKTAEWAGPPNCMEGGEYRATLQFESAAGDLNPDACRSGVCTTE